MKPSDYKEQFPLALTAIAFSFINNEHKHGEGLHFSTVKKEVDACLRHGGEVLAYGAEWENTGDRCMHLTSQAARAMKALELFLRQNPEYVLKYSRTIEVDAA